MGLALTQDTQSDILEESWRGEWELMKEGEGAGKGRGGGGFFLKFYNGRAWRGRGWGMSRQEAGGGGEAQVCVIYIWSD